ncbi:hypothetical protein [Cochlodiniinecator piscidefendens]|uniref:hypothetical protein n=1 Tax=Cochlodiniinecator piscidefendens TaxID=2715756 RepID=UPI00140BA968|nr:hypothetical protein [Cochlodiniinecator piscidefendens]
MSEIENPDVQMLLRENPEACEYLCTEAKKIFASDEVAALNLLGQILDAVPDLEAALATCGMHFLEKRQGKEAEPYFERLVQVYVRGETPRVSMPNAFSHLSGTRMFLMAALNMQGLHGHGSEVYQEILAEHHSVELRGTFKPDDRDLENITRCLERIIRVLENPSGPTPATIQGLARHDESA